MTLPDSVSLTSPVAGSGCSPTIVLAALSTLALATLIAARSVVLPVTRVALLARKQCGTQEMKKLPEVTVSQGGKGLRTWSGSDWTGMPCSFLATRPALDHEFGSHAVDETTVSFHADRRHLAVRRNVADTFPNADSSMWLLAVNTNLPHGFRRRLVFLVLFLSATTSSC